MDDRERIEALKNYNGPDRVVSSVTMGALLDALPPVTKNITGIAGLDAAIGGFEAGELVVISGPTSMGKTLLCSSIARNLNDGSKYALFFSFEVTPRKLIEDFRDTHHMIYLPLEQRPNKLEWIRDRVQEAILKYNVSAIFVDHLHYLIEPEPHINMSLLIGKAMRFLKQQVCIGLNTTVFLVCHSSKVPFGQKVGIEHLRDSSFVGQEADTVLIVGRREDKDLLGRTVQGSMLQGLATIHIGKARRTGNMGVDIRMKKEGHQLVESMNEQEGLNADSNEDEKNTTRSSRRYGRD